MARARVQINGVAARNAFVSVGSTITLSNDDEGGEVTYLWSVVDQPEGIADNLTSSASETTTITITKEGTYLVRLVVNLGTGTEAIQTAALSVVDGRTGERIPAATETIETSTSKGWSLATNRIFQRVLKASVDGNVQVASTDGTLVPGRIVRLTGVKQVHTGQQSQYEVVGIASALGTGAVAGRVGILIDGVTPGDLANGDLVLVRMFGLVPFAGTGSPAVGDPVYLSNTGTASLTPGTVPRQIGTVVAASGGSFRWMIDGVASSGSSSSGGLFDKVITATQISFGAAFDVWDPGTTFGTITLVRCTTDGATRDVRGLKIPDGPTVDGAIVALQNVNANPAFTPKWKHLSGTAVQFFNSAGTDATGNSGGTVWYRYESTNTLWRQLMQTSGA